MTDMPYEDFALPSALPGGGGVKVPGMHQLKGRLIHMFPTAVEYGVTSELKKEPHTRLTCDVTFLDGDPIPELINGVTQARTPLTPPVQPGQTMVGMWISQAWFVARLEKKVGQPGFPGIIGIVGTMPTSRGTSMVSLTDPTPAQVEQVKAWFAWKNANPGQGVYVPAAPVAQVGVPAASATTVYAQPAPAPVDPWAPVQQAPAMPNPFAQPVAQPAPAAAPTGAPLPPWQQG